MADIGLNPRETRHDLTIGGVATEAGILFGDVVIYDVSATGQGRAVTRTTTPGGGKLRGVCVTQTDPVNGCAIGDNLEICVEGIVEVNIVAAQASFSKGQKLCASATAGAAKAVASEDPLSTLGEANMDYTENADVIRISVWLNIQNA